MPGASVGRTADMPVTTGQRTAEMPTTPPAIGRRTAEMPTTPPAIGRRTAEMPTTPPAVGRRNTADVAAPAVGRRTADVAARRPDVAEVPKRQPTPDPTRRPPTSRPPANRRTKSDSAQAADVKRLIAQRLELVRTNANHYQLLGTSMEASAEAIRRAYFALARQLHPDRLSALGIVDGTREAQRLFAQVNTAFAVLSDPKRRTDYTNILRRGGEAAIRAEEKRAELLQMQIVAAEEAYLRGELAMRRDQTSTAVSEFARAVELNPEEADYHSLLAWAQFCASPDKMAVASATRVALDRAIARSPRAVAGRFYLGRVERMLGRDHDALRHFQEVLRLEPQHQDAAAEARMIEARGGRKR
jgi:tetratricopeptide (TPR) repeat protein